MATRKGSTRISKAVAAGKATKPKPKDVVYQFKITLLRTQPPIWRRIQVRECSLDKLHEHIQTAMGWTNSHLHHFKFGKQLYGDPMLWTETFVEFGYRDSTTTMLADVMPKTNRRLPFIYEYDMGDCWEHGVEFEGRVAVEAGRKYPMCVEGERACPPEDVGGVWGYADFLAAIGDKKHERHRELLEWIGGRFDPEEFDPNAATKFMTRGLPDWRSMR